MDTLDRGTQPEFVEDEIDLRQYFQLIKDWIWLLVLAALLAGIAAYVTSSFTTPIYSTSATLLINQARSPSSATYQDILSSERIAKTYAELMVRQPILSEVAVQLGLDPENFDKVVTSISVTPVRDTQLIQITVEDDSPELAAGVANILPTVFIAENEKLQSERFSASKINLQNQLNGLDLDIVTAQADLDRLLATGSAADQGEISRLRNTITQYQSSYASLLQSYESLRLTEAQSIDTITVVEPARIPENPVRPRTMLNTLLAAIVGLMLATGAVFLIEFLDDTIKTPEDLNNILRVTWLGAIARMDGADTVESMVTVNEPRHPTSEAYRALRTNLQFSAIDTDLRSIVLTSANPGEGKTTTAVNLAIVMAQAGFSVALVDADLRRPRVHKLFGFNNTMGLTDAVVHSDLPASHYLRPTTVENLRVMTSGKIPPNPAELLGSRRMTDLLERLRDEVDLVICDAPPTLAVTDAAIIGRQVDGILLVVDSGKTRKDAGMRAVESLRRVNGHILGAVLNRLSRSSRGYYYYYDGYYTSDPDQDGKDGKGKSRRNRSGKRESRPTAPSQPLEGVATLAKSEN